MPKVTIVVPVYNCEKYLVPCLGSILKQTYTDWECIVWDDGSTDESLMIIRDFCSIDPRFKCGFNEENSGLPYTLNLAYVFSTGKYLCQVDADDELLPMALYETVQYLEQNKDVDLVYTNKLCVNEDDTRWFEHIGNKEHYSRIKLFYTYPLVTHFRLMRREVWEVLKGYKTDITFGEDDDFAIRAAWGINADGKRVRNFKIKKLNNLCYLYRIRRGSMTNSVRDDNQIFENREYLKKRVLWSPWRFWRITALIEQIRWYIYKLERGE